MIEPFAPQATRPFCTHARYLHGRPVPIFICLLFCLLLASCSMPGKKADTATESADVDSKAKATEETTPELPPRPFSEDTLLNLLVGELAVYERDIATAASQYQREARITRDTAVSERAARLTRYLRDKQAALSMAQLWYELDPDNSQAAANLADLYARNQQPSEALDILESQLDKGQQPSFAILRNSQFKSPEARQAIIDRLEQIPAAHPQSSDNYSLIFMQTVLLQQNGQIPEALQKVKQLKHFESDPIQLAKIEAQLLSELKRDTEASQVLAKALKEHPDDKSLRIEYARKLTRHDLKKAQELFAQLLTDYPDEKQLLMSHALVAIENKDYPSATQSLQTLVEQEQLLSHAHFNLGLIAEIQQDDARALQHFKKVKPGDKLLPAIQKTLAIYQKQDDLNAAREYLSELRGLYSAIAPTLSSYEASLLSDAGQHKEAHELLTTAIERSPGQHELRIQRAYLSDKLQWLDLFEYDLKYVLKRDPNNVDALNSLGYVLADKTTRYVEAESYIRKALELLPESAAILDSMGWVLYKQGQQEEALSYLNRAYEKMKDDEIAAHLIEIYWLTDQAPQAKKVYKSFRKYISQQKGEGQDKRDKNKSRQPKIDEVMQRLNIAF